MKYSRYWACGEQFRLSLAVFALNLLSAVVTLAFIQLWILVMPINAFAAEDVAADKKDPGITSSQADAILTELRQIRQLLEQQTRPAAPPLG